MSNELQLFDFIHQFAGLARKDRFAAYNVQAGKGYTAQTSEVTGIALQTHLSGIQPIAVYPVRGEEVQMAAFDLDDKGGKAGWADMQSTARKLCEALRDKGLVPFPVRSGGGHGIHIFLLWAAPQSARNVRVVLKGVLSACGLSEATSGIAADAVEIYPKQDRVLDGKLGSAIALPFSRNSCPLSPDFELIGVADWEVPMLAELFSPDLPPEPPNGDHPNGSRDDPPAVELEVPLEGDVELAREALSNVSSEDHDQWIKVGLALKRAFGNAGRKIWVEWSSRATDKFPGISEVEARWAALDPDGRIGLGTIFHLATAAGWNGPQNREVRAMNARFGILTHGSKALIIVKNGDRRPEDEFNTLSKDAFLTRLKPEMINLQSPDGAPIRKEKARWWLDHKHAAHYHRLDFDPALPPGHNGVVWNLWSGFSQAPAAGTWDRYRAHIEEVICGGNDELAAWLLNWLALGLQKPGEVIGTAPVLLGPPGTGKGFFVHQYGQLWGPHFSVVTHPEHVTGRFNAHLFAKRVLFIDEGTFGGSKRDAGVIKTRITEDWIMIEQKGVDPFRLRNRLLTLVASNEESAVTADLQDRRWQVLDVSTRRREDHAYFGAIVEEMDAGGRAAMMHDLLRRDIRQGPDPRKTIKTTALFGQILEASQVEFRYLHQLLDAGAMPGGSQRESGRCATTISDLWADFLASFPSARYANKATLGRRLQKLVPEIRTEQNGTYHGGRSGGERSTRYIWPPLSVARKAFERSAGQEVEWSDKAAEWSCFDEPV